MFCVVIYVLYTNIVHKMSLQREREIERKKDFRLLKDEWIPEVLSIFWAIRGDKLGFLKDRLIISIKIYKCFFMMSGKDRKYIKSSEYLGS